MKRFDTLISWICGGTQVLLATQVSEIREWILFALGCVSFVVGLVPLVINLIRRIQNATADGAIDDDEMQGISDAAKDLQDGIENKEKDKDAR